MDEIGMDVIRRFRQTKTQRPFTFLVCVLLLATLRSSCGDVIPDSVQKLATDEDPKNVVTIITVLGETVVFNCHLEFPDNDSELFRFQWEKEGLAVPVFIWNSSVAVAEGYDGRVSSVSSDSPYGFASLNLTDVRESDGGRYECKVVIHGHQENSTTRSSFKLEVRTPPRFTSTSDEAVYVNLGDDVTLICRAEGTPAPEILWLKNGMVMEPSNRREFFNHFTEMQILDFRQEDVGNFSCAARSEEGQVSHTVRVVIARGAVITRPPMNQTKLEGERVLIPCGSEALPSNVSLNWYREGKPIGDEEPRFVSLRDGTLAITRVKEIDSGRFECRVSNGIGEPQSAWAFLDVQYPAKVTVAPTTQHLILGQAGVVQCGVSANPPTEYVTWVKNRRLLDPELDDNISVLNNGFLLISLVTEEHQGTYSCTPYNEHGTQGTSNRMEVAVYNLETCGYPTR